MSILGRPGEARPERRPHATAGTVNCHYLPAHATLAKINQNTENP
jgi:hypothetical protein